MQVVRAQRGVLAGAFALLRALAAAGGSARLGAVARAAGLPRSTAHRLLTQLIDEGAVERRGEEYALGTGLHRLASGWEPWPGLREAAAVHLEHLARAGLGAALIHSTADEAVVIEQRKAQGPAGGLDPSAHSHLLLGGLAGRRRALAHGEPDPRHACVAAAVPGGPSSGLVALAVLASRRAPVARLTGPVSRIATALAPPSQPSTSHSAPAITGDARA